MAQQISEEMVAYVADLAKLSLDAEEVRQAQADMQQMLDYVDVLNELDTDAVTPLVHPVLQGNVFREDKVTNQDQSERILANAPESEEEQFVVPITIES